MKRLLSHPETAAHLTALNLQSFHIPQERFPQRAVCSPGRPETLPQEEVLSEGDRSSGGGGNLSNSF